MAQITAALVKELRDRTGAGMGDCKKALEATGGDLDKAAEKLRMDGAAKADKKAGRTAAEGVLAFAAGADAVAVVELNCETDFVAKGEDFRALARRAAEAALKHRPASVDELARIKDGAETLDEARRALIARIGENMTIRRFAIVTKAGGPLVTYMHPGDKIGVIVALDAGDEGLGRDLAMHIAAMKPAYLDAASVPAEVLEAERRIVEAQVAQEQAEARAAAEAAGKPYKPKPAEILAKMIEGKVSKFVAENTLLGQPFVKNPDETVEKLLKTRSARVARYVRFEVGEGIEKQKGDFAAEVMAQAGIKA
ncbi:translation elongation factor Ts (EF-Ts) [Fontimonas thermophila]|uniref:Elongation factor Ts n=1 Tax=Fontimonas thermophila TaxID=1076937 RepID=A0A1I2HJF8_9GAMM|nr:translation elongation factor Ts [Fontimonas thermophila]SFF29832.1 translation elongation factor Ts (EF-Ts) [Fontimonas thermophila]